MRNHPAKIILLCILLFFGVALIASADTATSTPSNYGEMYSAAPDTHYSSYAVQTYSSLTARSGVNIPAGLFNGDSTSSTLTLYSVSTNTSGKQICIYPATKKITNGITWNKYDGTNNWSTPGGDFTATAVDCQTSGGAGSNLVFNLGTDLGNGTVSKDYIIKYQTEDGSNIYDNFTGAALLTVNYTAPVVSSTDQYQQNLGIGIALFILGLTFVLWLTKSH